MAKKIRLITTQGHRVIGALATYLSPKMAADKALKAGDLDSIVKSIKPAKFGDQINGIVGTVKEKFTPRLAKDAELDPEELRELMEAIEPFEDYEEDELPVDPDLETMDADGPGEQLMAMLAECGIPEEKLTAMNDLITQLGKPAAQDADLTPEEKAEKDKAAKDKAAKDKAAKDKAAKDGEGFPPKKEEPKAMDAKTIEKNVTASIAARFKAAEEVKAFVGSVDALSFDSAENIYKHALDAGGVSTKDVHPSAFRSLLVLLGHQDEVRPAVAMDAKAQADLAKKYPHIPAQA